MPTTVLVVGGTGYLGQFLVDDFVKRGWTVAYTHHSTQRIEAFAAEAQAHWVDLASGEGLQRCFDGLGTRLDAVINCAAVSQPVMCEKDPAYARSINIPTSLLAALEARRGAGVEPLLIHLSTDQVYDGSKAGWSEADACEPVNQYGRSKLEAEAAVAQRWPRHVILRSSIIYGPAPPGAPVSRMLFLQFVDNALGLGKATTFFEDEYRCPVHVADIVKACAALVDKQAALGASGGGDGGGDGGAARVFNMGGPERLSRVDMAQAVAGKRGYDSALILRVPAASVDRGVASPADISMDSSRLWDFTGVKPMTFARGLDLVFGRGATDP